MLRSLIVSLLLVAACSASAPTTSPSPALTAAPTTGATPSPTAMTTAAPSVTAAPTSGYSCDPDMSYGCDETPTPRASAPAGGPLVVGTAADNSRLVDADGLTLYVFDNDSPGESACNSGCADTWPPLVLAAGQELQAQPDIAEGFSTFIRGDGATQVAYTGRPLYRFSGDSSPGDVNGDGIGGVWHIATP